MDTSALVLVERIETIDAYLTGSPRAPFDVGRTPIVIVVEHGDDIDFAARCEAILRKLWHNYGIANAIVIAPFVQSAQVCALGQTPYSYDSRRCKLIAVDLCD